MITDLAHTRYSAAYLEQISAYQWLNDFRSKNLTVFNQNGFPNSRQEEWRYTNLAALSKTLYQPSQQRTLSETALAAVRIPDTWAVVLINGHFSAEHSDLTDLPAGLSISSFQQALANPALVDLLGKAVSAEEHGLIAFNNAWFTDGVVISVAENMQISKPVQIIHLVSETQALAATRQLIKLEQQASLSIIESYAGHVEQYLTVSVNECFLAEHAQLNWYKLQSEAAAATHFGGTYVKQAAESHFNHHNFALGGLLARSEIHTDLSTASECSLNGLYLGKNRQHFDNHTRINHLKPKAISREYYKGVLDHRARGVFQGRIVVAEDAQQTDSSMDNKNLLLSADAEIDTKPQLEIYADDVKCSHGVSVGQLDEQAIFFLQARGIAPENAKEILTFAFANELVDKVEHPALQHWLRLQVLEQFPSIKL